MYLGRQKPSETTSSVLRSTYTGNGSTTTYALPGPVANETSIIATINGVTQQDGAYSTDGSNIIFDAAPALGDSIELRTISAVAMSYAPMDGSVVTGKIADLAVTTGKIADNSITTAKIAPGAVVQADLAAGVAGTGPAFSAYLAGGSLSVSNATLTKYTATVERFDTNSCYDAPNARFTPNVAGYYFISLQNWFSSGTGNTAGVLQKNGSSVVQEYDYMSGGTTSRASSLIYFNGTTDYIEAYVYQFTGGTISLDTNSLNAGFYGYMVRAA